MADPARTRVLLEKAYRVLKDIEECMNSGKDYSDPYVECPLCMGELLDKDDLELIDFIKKHLGEK